MNQIDISKNNFSFFVLCILSTILIFSCKQETKQKASGDFISTEISIAEAKEKLESGNFTFIDIRTPEEIAETGKIEGALEMDFFDKEFKSKFAALDKDKPYVIYCRSGGRSGKTSKIAQKLGFKEIYDMSPGFSKWK